MVTFKSLHLAAPLLRALEESAYHTPTPIQAQAIPPALEGRDLLGCAQTGTGKTAAFALPILQRLTAHRHAAHATDGAHGPRSPRVLVLAPTRELATQINESFATYGAHTGIVSTVIFGGVSQHHQVIALKRGVDVLVATPGRLIDLMQQRLVRLDAVETFVLDEADRMLDMGFIEPVRRIAKALTARKQTMLFSATMPKEIVQLAESLLKNPVRVAVTPVASTVPKIDQSVYMVSQARKQALLTHLLREGNIVRAIVFTRTKHGADRVSVKLNRVGISADAIHGNKAQNRRQRALEGFRNGTTRVLVATDIAARGIDIDGVTHVFNVDLPDEPESYVHRIGRTARSGATGTAIAFCDAEERGNLRDIEKLIGKPIRAITTLPVEVDAVAREVDASGALAQTKSHGSGQSHSRGGGHGRSQPRAQRGGAPRHDSKKTKKSGDRRDAGSTKGEHRAASAAPAKEHHAAHPKHPTHPTAAAAAAPPRVRAPQSWRRATGR
ncbi:MAG: DEAD/DEAH box helicase [Phycisphaerales bacterium]